MGGMETDLVTALAGSCNTPHPDAEGRRIADIVVQYTCLRIQYSTEAKVKDECDQGLSITEMAPARLGSFADDDGHS